MPAFAIDFDGSVFSLYAPLRALLRRAPVIYPPGTPLREALDHMLGERIGSVLVGDAASGMVEGIITATGVMAAMVREGAGLGSPVEAVMDRRLHRLPEDATAHEAVLIMARSASRYVLVCNAEGAVCGVVSRSDIYSAQRIASESVVNAVLSARTAAALATAADDVREFSHRLLRQGLAASQIIQWVSSLNDLITLQAIDLMRARFDLPEVRWCWLAFGSEGRFEQTFATDQDNGIIFEVPASGDTEALRARFLPFAQAVNQALDDCGFPLCKGQIMAGNQQWCLSLDEWRSRFTDWIDGGDPKALLNASIFFDFRALYGERALADVLRAHLLERAPKSSRFLHQMAKNALEASPPLGLLRAFVLDRDKEFPKTIDLKLGGSRPYVDAARLLALANGIPATGTVERLRALAARDSFSQEDLQAAIDGFHFVQLLRLRRQISAKKNDPAPNRINPYKLNQLERQVLRHALHQGKRLQGRLRVDYRL